jgi:hypothetical protein
MPKITVGDGATHGPLDAPNARPSDEAYDDAMSRHGTADYTEADKQLVDRYRQVRADEQRAANEERDGAAPGAYGRDADDGEGEQPSPGNSSATSGGKTPKNDETNEADHRSPARTTANRSSKDQKDNSTAASTAGSGRVTPESEASK